MPRLYKMLYMNYSSTTHPSTGCTDCWLLQTHLVVSVRHRWTFFGLVSWNTFCFFLSNQPDIASLELLVRTSREQLINKNNGKQFRFYTAKSHLKTTKKGMRLSLRPRKSEQDANSARYAVAELSPAVLVCPIACS